MANNRKLIFFDIDGTLLNDKKTINPSTISTIKSLQKEDFSFCLATGRGLSEGILDLANQLSLNDYLVLANGNYIWDIKNQKLITLGSPINKNIISWFVEKAKEYKRQLNLFFEDGSIKYYYFGKNINIDVKEPKFFVIGPTIYNFENIDNLENDLCKSIIHVGIKAEQNIINKIFSEFQTLDMSKLVKTSTVSEIFLEVESLGVSKWLGIQFVQRKLNILNEDSYAFGDSLNDLDMLENIGNPICMGNADQALKDKMKVIIGDNNSDAISDFLISLANK
ncbi:MAG: HAD family hydrolase [Candidatus Ureaplasma intestinipullorum]|uniref:HAD family hydrolase n=1 Tax=Candidatus Ureaplasma intestinipullorum TaxID=2838770 RepID=A0A9E2KW92_9BACT|nr:HAD family hydrolase [Candidatus Ureaplasma intestinipullorum]